MMSADEALERLAHGNRRFVENIETADTLARTAPAAELVQQQQPFAVILGCSDARVPAEIVFGQGLGDLFVIRVAGNVVTPPQTGSVEFAAAEFGTRLVVVLGHTQCGAVTATLNALQNPDDTHSENLLSIVDRVRPSVAPLLESGKYDDHDALIRKAVRANVRASVAQLRQGSELLENLIQSDGLRVVGAEYAIETGQVDFFDTETGA